MENTTENKKAIAWVRCSTDKQHTTDEQYNAILAMAKMDGYTENDLFKIGREGASAIRHNGKMSDEYTADRDTLYNLIESGSYSTVYAWALDRLARDERESIKLKWLCMDNGVTIKTADGVQMAKQGVMSDDILYYIKTMVAEDEMRKKQARFKIGKDRNRKLGRWNGGKVCYGYKVNKDGYFEVDEETANVVRRIFNTYINTNESTTTIARALYNEGITDRKTEKGRTNFVLHILKNKNYLGEHPFTRLITDEDFEKAQAKMKGCKFQPRHTQNTCENYAHGLLRVKNDAAKNGYFMMTIRRGDGQYVECNSMYCIDADTIDSLLLQSANKYIASFSEKDAAIKVREITDKIETMTSQTGVLTKRLNQIDNKIQRVERSWIEGVINDEKRNIMQGEYKAEKKKTAEQIDSLQQDIINLSDRITAIMDGCIDNLYSLNDKDRTTEIGKIINYCDIVKVSKGTYNVTIHYKLNGVEVYQVKCKAHKYYTVNKNELIPIEVNKLNRYTYNRVRQKKVNTEVKKAV